MAAERSAAASCLKEKYDFDLTDAWLERAQKASVRFNNGGSGGFVSPDGLIVTNHHIGADCAAKAQHARTRTISATASTPERAPRS